MATKKIFNIQNETTINDSFVNLKSKPKTHFTIEELVNKYKNQIKTALSIGCSFDDICNEVFTKNGCNVKSSELKTTYNRLTTKRKNQATSKVAEAHDQIINSTVEVE